MFAADGTGGYIGVHAHMADKLPLVAVNEDGSIDESERANAMDYWATLKAARKALGLDEKGGA